MRQPVRISSIISTLLGLFFLGVTMTCADDNPSVDDERDGGGNNDGESPLSWSEVNDFVYQLQNIDLALLGSTAFDLVIMDYSGDGSDVARFTPSEISKLKKSSGGPKLILSYLSIGEAENYRWYWDPRWDLHGDGEPDGSAPTWLASENPEWEGNYKVRFWEPEWQSIVVSYLNRIIDAGFDGVYLDIIDAYEFWGPGGESGAERESAAREMVDFVKMLANHARIEKQQPDFGVFPQNGEALATYHDYIEVITGLAKEDLWYMGNRSQSPEYVRDTTAYLEIVQEAKKLVLVVEYPTLPAPIEDVFRKASHHGFLVHIADRELSSVIIPRGHEPD